MLFRFSGLDTALGSHHGRQIDPEGLTIKVPTLRKAQKSKEAEDLDECLLDMSIKFWYVIHL
jgi:hypothetical protein